MTSNTFIELSSLDFKEEYCNFVAYKNSLVSNERDKFAEWNDGMMADYQLAQAAIRSGIQSLSTETIEALGRTLNRLDNITKHYNSVVSLLDMKPEDIQAQYAKSPVTEKTHEVIRIMLEDRERKLPKEDFYRENLTKYQGITTDLVMKLNAISLNVGEGRAKGFVERVAG